MLAAAVAAGVKTGKLGDAVEVLGDMAHDVLELRQRVLNSLTYPLTVMGLAMVLFFMFVRRFLYSVQYVVLNDPESQTSPLLDWMISFDRHYHWWPLAIPAFAAICLAVWFFSGRAASISFAGPERMMLLLPGVKGLVRDLQFYNLTRMLSLLTDRGLPLTESLLLSGACCGNSSLDNACQNAVADLERGNLTSAQDGVWNGTMLPPLVATSLQQVGENEDALKTRLAGVSGYYRRRLTVSLLWLRNIVPTAMFIIIGGGSVVMYGLTVFWPVTEIYRLLAPG